MLRAHLHYALRLAFVLMKRAVSVLFSFRSLLNVISEGTKWSLVPAWFVSQCQILFRRCRPPTRSSKYDESLGRREGEGMNGIGQWTMGLEYIVSWYNNTLKSLVIKGPMHTFSSEFLDLVFSPTKVALCVWYQDVDIHSLCGVCNWESVLKCSPVASPLAGHLMPMANIFLSSSSGWLIRCWIT